LRAAPPADWPHRSAHTAPLAPAPLCARCSRLRRLLALSPRRGLPPPARAGGRLVPALAPPPPHAEWVGGDFL
jgi:hypothetical protein